MQKESWWIDKRGQIDGLSKRYDEFNSQLAPNEIEVEVKAIGLNYADVFCVLGLYAAAPKENFVPGLEYSGVVKNAGKDVKRFKVGDRIMGCTRFGAFSSKLVIDEDYCQLIPDDWSFEEGAAFTVQALTAWYALVELGRVQKGENVIVQSAAGGVGLHSMHFAKVLGANPIATVRSEKKKNFLKDLGYSECIVRSDNFGEQVTKQLNKRPLNLALDAIGGVTQKALFDRLAQRGRLVIFGLASFTPSGNKFSKWKAFLPYLRRPKYDPFEMIPGNRSVLCFNIIFLYQEKKLMRSLFDQMCQHELYRPHVGKTFPFNQTVEALRFLKTGQNIGKVVLKL